MRGRKPYRSTLFGLLILVAALFPAFLQAADISPGTVVVAVDSSRSLSPGDMKGMWDTVHGILDHMPAKMAFGLMAFGDEPQWILEPPATAAQISEALPQIRPVGNFTLLNDALIMAARRIPESGIILLLTDGRDENSATTVEDVAGICRRNHVRIFPIEVGRRVDGKALRRLALLSEGSVLGRAGRVEAAEAADSILQGLGEAAGEVEASRPEVQAPPATELPAATPVPPQVETPSWLLPLLLLLLLAICAVFLLLLRRPKASGSPTPIGERKEWETDPVLRIDEAAPAPDPEVRLGPTPPMEKEADELRLDPSAYERLPFSGDLDRTTVLDEQHILSLREEGKTSRSFRLREDRAFAVGRAPGVNTLVLQSKALSTQHFKIVPHDGGFAIVDLESTNGTLVNGRRIRAHHLNSGDVIQAGDIEFEYKRMLQSLS